MDGESTWIEIFPPEICKSHACAWLARRHQIDAATVIAVGNDTNDLDMLRWAGHARVVGNAHPSLLEEFEAVASNDDDGFCVAARLVPTP